MQAITLEVILRAVFGITDERRRDELSGALVEILGATGITARRRVHRPRPAPHADVPAARRR